MPSLTMVILATIANWIYVFPQVNNRKYPKLKEVDDVLGGAAAWENVDSTAGEWQRIELAAMQGPQMQHYWSDYRVSLQKPVPNVSIPELISCRFKPGRRMNPWRPSTNAATLNVDTDGEIEHSRTHCNVCLYLFFWHDRKHSRLLDVNKCREKPVNAMVFYW